MPDIEKVIRGLECCVCYDYKCNDCPYQDDGGAEDGCYYDELKADALALLKAQEKATIEPKRIDLDDETKAWLDKMDAVDALGNIADICMDWDGYRTVNGLGGLVNEIWAYARYCADRLLKAQEAEPTKFQIKTTISNVDIPKDIDEEQFMAVLSQQYAALARLYGDDVPTYNPS